MRNVGLPLALVVLAFVCGVYWGGGTLFDLLDDFESCGR